MSYKCEFCKKQIKRGIPQMKIVMKRRNVKFEESTRSQIMEEKKACPVCYGKVKR